VTVAIAVKVFDGVVLATDSATSLTLQGGGAQVYNNANKVFHLHRKKPIGAMTWGLGNIGDASIATLMKDFRRRLMGKDPDHPNWEIQANYTVESVVDRMVDLLHDELYSVAFAQQQAPFPELGMMVVGYSHGERQAEGWTVVFKDPATRPIASLTIARDQVGWVANAQTQATHRLFNGYEESFKASLMALIPQPQQQLAEQIFSSAVRQPAQPAMPFADALSLARFLVDTTAGFSHFSLGPDTVGGEVEIAGITRYEGFKWVSRKHYYSPSLNPEDPGHDF
jgi:hypothetical protein